MTRVRAPRAIALAVALVAAIGLTAAMPASAAPAAKKKPVLTVTELPGQVRLLDGEAVKITLTTNVTTGYSWSTKVLGDAKAVTVSKGVYKAPTSDLVGAPGQTTWTVRATGDGVARVQILTTPPGGGAAQKVGVLTVYAGDAVTKK